MLTARRRQPRRYRRHQKSIEWVRYAVAAGKFILSSALCTLLIVMVVDFDITIKLDINVKARSGFVAETQIRPAEATTKDLRK
jgi:hypothetical protein